MSTFLLCSIDHAADTYPAHSLLDNMRLIRIASLTRKLHDPAASALAHRLRKGLPDSSFVRAEDYFARRSDNTQKTEDLKAEQRKLDAAMADKRKREEEAYRLEQERKRLPLPQSHPHSRLAAEQHPLSGRGSGTGPSSDPFGRSDGVAPSPATLEAAHLLVQRRSPLRATHAASQRQTSAPPSSKPAALPPSPVRGSHQRAVSTSASDSQNRRASPEDGVHSMSSFSPSPESRPSRIFPLRGAETAREPKVRIIDRRRARNEVLRKKYAAQRAEKAAQKEARQSPAETVTSSTPSSAPVPPTAAVRMQVVSETNSVGSSVVKADSVAPQVRSS